MCRISADDLFPVGFFVYWDSPEYSVAWNHSRTVKLDVEFLKPGLMECEIYKRSIGGKMIIFTDTTIEDPKKVRPYFESMLGDNVRLVIKPS